MSWRIKSGRACDDCGQVCYSRRRPNRPYLCVECAITHATVAALEMAAKSGPAWDKHEAAANRTRDTRGDT